MDNCSNQLTNADKVLWNFTYWDNKEIFLKKIWTSVELPKPGKNDPFWVKKNTSVGRLSPELGTRHRGGCSPRHLAAHRPLAMKNGDGTINIGIFTNNVVNILLIMVNMMVIIWLMMVNNHDCLVVFRHLPLWKMMEFVSWDDDMPFPTEWKVNPNSMVPMVPNQQPVVYNKNSPHSFPWISAMSTEFPRRKPIRSNKIRNSALLDVTSYLLTGKS